MLFVLILHWYEFILSYTLLPYVTNFIPLVCHGFYHFLTYMLKLPCKWDHYHLALTHPYFIYFLIFITGLLFLPFFFQDGHPKGNRKTFTWGDRQVHLQNLEEKLQLEQPVHLHISACTEDGAIFKCGEVDTDLHGLVTLLSQHQWFIFLVSCCICIFDCMFIWFCAFSYYLVEVIFSFSRNFYSISLI